MTFGTPLALLGLIVVPFLIVVLVIGERRRRAQAAAFGKPALLATSLPAPRRIRRLQIGRASCRERVSYSV